MHKRTFFLVATFPLLQACDAGDRPDQVEQAPVLEAPEAGLDDPAAYEGYATRFFRDSHGNTFQIYLNQRDSRVVHVWGDAANESAAFTVRDADGGPAPIVWGGAGAVAESDGERRTMRHRLVAEVGQLEVGWFLLGTMRQERDFQYLEWHNRPFGDSAFILPELAGLVASLERLPDEERAEHLSLLGAADTEGLRSRLEPRTTLSEDEGTWTVLVEQTSLDGRNHLTVELSGDSDASTATLEEDRVSVLATSGNRIVLDVSVTTDSEALTPLGRERLFNDAFEEYFERQLRIADSLTDALGPEPALRDPRVLAVRRIERQVLGLELLGSEQKLMASMPNYATYFGRDQMMSALMLEPISSVDLQELVIASVLGKIDRSGNVSHEEALAGQAIREAAAEYSAQIRAWEESRERDPQAAARHLARARALLEAPQTVRENYHMVDDDFQLAVLVDRYLSRLDVPAERKRRFLSAPASGAGASDSAGGGETRLDALVRNLAFAAELAHPYAEEPLPTNLVSFFRQDDRGWLPGSWRDSRAGYGNGRFAMDVNVVWVPKALEALERTLGAVETLGLSIREPLDGLAFDAPALEAYLADPATLRAAIRTWREAREHFQVRLDPEEVRTQVDALLETLPEAEADYWRKSLEQERAARRALSFLALSLDAEGRPIRAVNTDPATDLFLEDYSEAILAGSADAAAVLGTLDMFVRPYPVGLFVAGLGPIVANDAYASQAVQVRFREDLYHSPRVVWGREVNLLLLGLLRQIAAAYDESGELRDDSEMVRAYLDALRRALDLTQQAVDASGLSHNELWSYEIEGGTLRPVRYGTSSDIQLWNVTDLAVAFLRDRLQPQ
jgi:hypothetical protein